MDAQAPQVVATAALMDPTMVQAMQLSIPQQIAGQMTATVPMTAPMAGLPHALSAGMMEAAMQHSEHDKTITPVAPISYDTAPKDSSQGHGQGPLAGRKHSADRRPLRFWQPFNEWWRAELDRLGRRPTAQEIADWYNQNANIIWADNKPSLQETRVHAKCLRSLPLVRDYFRNYRAKKKVRMSGMGEDGTEHDTGEGEDDGGRMRMQNGGRGDRKRKRSHEGGAEDDLGGLSASALAGVDLMQLPHAGLMPHTAFWPTGMDVQGADSEYQRVYFMQQLQQAAVLQQQMAMATFTGGIPGQQGFPGAFLGNPEGEEEEDESTEDEGHAAAAASAHAAGEAEVNSAPPGGAGNPHQPGDAAALDAAAAAHAAAEAAAAAAAAAGMSGAMDMSGMLHNAGLEQQMLHQQGMEQQAMSMGVPHPGDHSSQQQPEGHPGAEGVGLGLGLGDHQHHNAVAGMDGLGQQGLPPADSAAAAAAAAAMGFHPQGSADLTNAGGLGPVGSVHHDVHHGIPVLGQDPVGLQGGPDPHGAVSVSLPQVGSHGHLAGEAVGGSGVQDMAAAMVSEPQEMMGDPIAGLDQQHQQLAQQVSQLVGDMAAAAAAAAAAAGGGNGMAGIPGVDMGGHVQHDPNAAPAPPAEAPKPADLDVEEVGVVTEEEMEAMSKEQLVLQLKLVQEELLSKRSMLKRSFDQLRRTQERLGRRERKLAKEQAKYRHLQQSVMAWQGALVPIDPATQEMYLQAAQAQAAQAAAAATAATQGMPGQH